MDCMNKECCSECGHHGVGCVPSCYPAYCHNKACACHTNRGEIGTINMHIQPTGGGNGAVQPESSWEERFQEQFGGPIKGWRDAITTFPEVTQFIRTEIEAAEERAVREHDAHWHPTVEGRITNKHEYNKGRHDVLEELEGKLPELYDEQTLEMSSGDLFHNRLGQNFCLTVILRIIKSIKGE